MVKPLHLNVDAFERVLVVYPLNGFCDICRTCLPMGTGLFRHLTVAEHLIVCMNAVCIREASMRGYGECRCLARGRA